MRKTGACVFRLLNVLFSDVFCAGVATLGDVATRQALDTHTLGSASSWWPNSLALTCLEIIINNGRLYNILEVVWLT
ncbi:hypothetical protein PR003_g2264 [Phytophthora rubi]|uniref:Secreted protein n=1 Tax=Phytophthora rubi TaxID=129364 RepID=A0A6A3NWX1_9STRA|nr:hypothetical protein PR002_g2029 [Phytophthora rubi]KAE9050730.1 hypothetical protein PR001_g2102 [Phytophthora rubi]KAE9356529.1 hypothetical protein PR003_g2264 [Phytophthora rubi]